MSLFAIVLIVAAAFIHASWNYLAKRAGGSAPFVWLFAALSALFYAPITFYVVLTQNISLDSTQLIFIAGSGVLHMFYFVVLQRGYRVGDLSLVYPLARGTGPALSTTAAILFLGERPSLVALGGAGLVIVGVFLLTWSATYSRDPRAARKNRAIAVAYGLVTGTIIAGYTLWDKQAVSAQMISPIVLDYFSSLARMILLMPIALGQWSEVQREWREHRREVIGVAMLTPLAYILVLTAMITTPVSYVAPARELSILIGAAMGTQLLAEGDARRRLTAAGAIVAGVIALAVG